jgi:hypothetical protein
MVERSMNVIELKGFSASVMEILLNSIYGEPVTVTSDNVQDILPAASLLQLNGTGSFLFLSFSSIFNVCFQIFNDNVLSFLLVILSRQIVWVFIVLLIYTTVYN